MFIEANQVNRLWHKSSNLVATPSVKNKELAKYCTLLSGEDHEEYQYWQLNPKRFIGGSIPSPHWAVMMMLKNFNVLTKMDARISSDPFFTGDYERQVYIFATQKMAWSDKHVVQGTIDPYQKKINKCITYAQKHSLVIGLIQYQPYGNGGLIGLKRDNAFVDIPEPHTALNRIVKIDPCPSFVVDELFKQIYLAYPKPIVPQHPLTARGLSFLCRQEEITMVNDRGAPIKGYRPKS